MTPLEKELLAALKKTLSWIENWSPEFTYDLDWNLDEVNARNIIAKAEAQSVGCGRLGHTDEGEEVVCGVSGELCDVCQQKAEAQEAGDE